MVVVVIGLGYVGCVSAACLAHIGHRVIGVDRDDHKVAAVNRGEAPFYEPGLSALVQAGLRQDLLFASTDLKEALRNADIALICVGTPSDRKGNMSVEHLQRVCEEIAAVRRHD